MVEVFLDALGLAEEEGRVLAGDFGEALEGLEGFLELLGELDVFLVLPGVAERGEPRRDRTSARRACSGIGLLEVHHYR